MRASALVMALATQVADPLIVASLQTSDLVIVTATAAALAMPDGGAIGSPMSEWIGPDDSAELWRRIEAGEVEGAFDLCHWERVDVAKEGWVVWRFSPLDSKTLMVEEHDEDRPPRLQLGAVAGVFEAALAIASDLEIEAVLQRIVDLARQVVPSKSAALVVSDEHGRPGQFVTSGLSDQERTNIGPLEAGLGLLGETIRQGAPLIVRDVSDDLRTLAFPNGHPPVRTLLATPIVRGDHVLGNLYLSERLFYTAFDHHDLEVVQVLAAHAAAAIERADLYQRVREQRDQQRIIVDSLPTGIVIVDAHGDVELVNRSMLELIFGRNAVPNFLPTYGREFSFRQPDGSPLPIAERPTVRALNGDTVGNRQLVLETGDGKRLPVSVQAAPLRGLSGEIERAIIVVQDVTRLREAEQLKDDFLSLVSHELRTPLTSIHGASHVLALHEALLDETTRHELLMDIVQESQSLDQTLSNMLRLTAILAGRFIATTEPVLVALVVDRLVAEELSRAGTPSIFVDQGQDVQPAECDIDLIEQVLRNVLGNAVKYTPQDRSIRVRVMNDSDSVIVRVTDEGNGIAPEEIGWIFDRFYRGSGDSNIRGMGLGMYISRSLMEAQGGRIDAASPGLGHGTSISVSMPIARTWQHRTQA